MGCDMLSSSPVVSLWFAMLFRIAEYEWIRFKDVNFAFDLEKLSG